MKNIKKVLSVILCFVVFAGSFSLAASAFDEAETIASSTDAAEANEKEDEQDAFLPQDYHLIRDDPASIISKYIVKHPALMVLMIPVGIITVIENIFFYIYSAIASLFEDAGNLLQ